MPKTVSIKLESTPKVVAQLHVYYSKSDREGRSEISRVVQGEHKCKILSENVDQGTDSYWVEVTGLWQDIASLSKKPFFKRISWIRAKNGWVYKPNPTQQERRPKVTNVLVVPHPEPLISDRRSFHRLEFYDASQKDEKAPYRPEVMSLMQLVDHWKKDAKTPSAALLGTKSKDAQDKTDEDGLSTDSSGDTSDDDDDTDDDESAFVGCYDSSEEMDGDDDIPEDQPSRCRKSPSAVSL